MAYETIDVQPMTVRIGAEIFGIDLGHPLSNRQVQEVHDALLEHQVIFFRDQRLEHESHKRLGRYFGDLMLHSGVAGLPDHPEIVEIRGDANSKYVAGERWHSDLSCDEIPPMGSILYLHTVPPVGGDTLFASMYAAYDALSPRMKAYLEGLTAVHDGDMIYKKYDPTRSYPINSHPIVRTHPVTKKKCLYFNAQYVTYIDEVERDESDAIFDYLAGHCAKERFQVRFRWRPNSVAFWDNRCTQHQAIWDYYPQVRSGYRVTIKGTKPF